MRRLLGLTACLLAAPLFLGGCGKKTAPVPPESAEPAPVSNLRGELDPEGVTLRWSWPRKTEKGENLRRVSEFIVERAEDRLDDFCGECPLHYQAVATLPGGALPDAEAADLSYRDGSLRPGYHYAYRVLSSLGWRVVSGPSQPLALTWQVPLAPPSGLTTESGELEVALSWQPPTRDRDGRVLDEPLRYQVERSEAGQPFRLVADALNTPFFQDQGTKSGLTYQYRVRAGRASGGTGEYSAPVAVSLRDLTPPTPPFGLAAVITGEAVRLFWEAPSSEDLAGTFIYRRRQQTNWTSDFEQIGQVGGRTSVYVDTMPLLDPAEVRYYALKAYDRATPPNLSDYSREVQITVKTSRP